MKTFKIVILDEGQLGYYGFKYWRDGIYDLRAQNDRTLWLRASNGYLQIISASTPSIKVLCEMYEAGVIRFEQFVREKKTTYQLTPDEVELVKKYREQKIL